MFRGRVPPHCVILGLTMIGLLQAGCRPDAPISPTNPGNEAIGRFELNFVPNWGGGRFWLNDVYRDPVNGDSVMFNSAKFYVSNVRLIREDGSEHKVIDYHLFDFSQNSSAIAKTAHLGGEWVRVELPEGRYMGVRYGIGLTPSQNGTDPSLMPNDHPLSEFRGMYWNWATGYRFVLLEGKLDTINDGVRQWHLDLAYHVGMNEFYREVEYIGSEWHFEIRRRFETQFITYLEFGNLFKSGVPSNPVINMRTENITHTAGSAERALSERLMLNWTAALYPVRPVYIPY